MPSPFTINQPMLTYPRLDYAIMMLHARNFIIHLNLILLLFPSCTQEAKDQGQTLQETKMRYLLRTTVYDPLLLEGTVPARQYHYYVLDKLPARDSSLFDLKRGEVLDSFIRENGGRPVEFDELLFANLDENCSIIDSGYLCTNRKSIDTTALTKARNRHEKRVNTLAAKLPNSSWLAVNNKNINHEIGQLAFTVVQNLQLCKRTYYLDFALDASEPSDSVWYVVDFEQATRPKKTDSSALTKLLNVSIK